MLFHPLSLVINIIDLLSLYFLFAAFLPSFRFVLQESAEGTLENCGRNGNILFLLQSVSFALTIVGISLVYPPILTGIMCGTGVIHMAGETGTRMLIVRLCVLLVLYIWHLIERCNTKGKQRPLNMALARGMLLVCPFVLLAVWLNMQMVWTLSHGASADCCTVVYGGTATGLFSISVTVWLIFLVLLSVLLLGLAVGVVFKKSVSQALLIVLLLIGVLWCLVASVCLYTFFAKLYYGGAPHRCLWCLFLPANSSVGYLFLVTIGAVFFQSNAILVRARLARYVPEMAEEQNSRMRRGGIVILAAVLVYVLLTIGPLLFVFVTK